VFEREKVTLALAIKIRSTKNVNHRGQKFLLQLLLPDSRLPLQPQYSGVMDKFLQKSRRMCFMWTTSPTHFGPQFALAVLIEDTTPHGPIAYPPACNFEVSSFSVGPFGPMTTRSIA